MTTTFIPKYEPVVAEAHTPPYKIHRYFARRPWNVFKQLVEVFSCQNGIVLDPFCGGGVTAYEGIRAGRKVIGFDINPLSIFIVKNMVQKEISLLNLDEAFSQVREYLQYLYGDYNRVNIKARTNVLFDEKSEVEWNELAFNVYCDRCGTKVLLSNNNRMANGRYYCSNPKCESCREKGGFLQPKDCKRDGYEYLFSVMGSSRAQEKILFENSPELSKQLKGHIKFLKKELKKKKVKIEKDLIPVNWDRQHEDLLIQKGIETFQDFFTERNLLLNTLVLHFINSMKADKKIYDALRLVFSSSLRDTNIMAFTNEDWQSGKPTTWAKHAYWVPSQFCEVNVLSSMDKAFNRVRSAISFNQQEDYDVKFADSFKALSDGKGNLLLKNLSIEDYPIPENSVDAIITDPPYGSNVQYLELSHFWYVWNKDLYGNVAPNFLREAVCNRKKNFRGAKNMKDYEDNLYRVFSKSYLALKPDGYMVLTFNNKDMGAWLALLLSIFRAGFVLEENGLYFQDGVDNYKQTAHTKYEGSPYGDFIYAFKKEETTHCFAKQISEDDFIKDIDRLFQAFFMKFKSTEHDRNEVINEMFLTVIPKIEAFVKGGGMTSDRQNIYSHFNKNYLKEIYA